MNTWVQGLGGKIVAIAFISFSAVANVIGGTRTITVTPQAATVYLSTSNGSVAGSTGATQNSEKPIFISWLARIPTSTLAAVADATESTTTANLLPKVKTLAWKVIIAAKPAATSSIASVSKVVPVIAAPIIKPTTTIALIATSTLTLPQTITAQSLLADTAFSFNQRLDGAYDGIFTASANGATILTWNYGDATIGGTGNVPQFSATYSCDPAANVATAASINQNDYFNVRSAYDCTVGLTPTSGADIRTQSQDFSATTDSGDLVIAPPPSMNSHLVSDENDGGFTFTNNDTQPITIIAATFDISYAGLSLTYGPLIFRPIDPSTGDGTIDYHMEGFTPDPTAQFTYGATGVLVPVSLTIPAQGQKFLPLAVLNVHKMIVEGLNPTITITLRAVTTDRDDIKIQLNNPQISWSCETTLAPYDPNATTGPYATGQACTN